MFSFSNIPPHGTTKREFLIKYLPQLVRGYVADPGINIHTSLTNAFPNLDTDYAEAHVALVLECINHALETLLGMGVGVPRKKNTHDIEDAYIARVEAVRAIISHLKAFAPSAPQQDGFVAWFVPRLTGRIASLYREKWSLDDLYKHIDDRIAVLEACDLYDSIDGALQKMGKMKAVPRLYESMWALIKAPQGTKGDKRERFDTLSITCDKESLTAFAHSMHTAASSPPLSVFARKAGLVDALRKSTRNVSVDSSPDTTHYNDRVRESARRCVESRTFVLGDVCTEFEDVPVKGMLAKAVYDVYCDAMAALGMVTERLPDSVFHGPELIQQIVPPDWYKPPFVSNKTLAAVIQCKDMVLELGGTTALSDAWVKKLAPFVTTQDDPRAVAREYKRIQRRMAECLEDEEDDARSVFSRA